MKTGSQSTTVKCRRNKLRHRRSCDSLDGSHAFRDSTSDDRRGQETLAEQSDDGEVSRPSPNHLRYGSRSSPDLPARSRTSIPGHLADVVTRTGRVRPPNLTMPDPRPRRLKENTVIAGMRYRSMEATRSGDLRSRTTAGVRRPRRTTGTTTAGSGGFAEQPEDGGVRPSPNEAGLRQPLVLIHGHPLELVERNSVESLTGYDSSGHRFPPFQDTTGSCEKNSLPLSSTRMKAGKSTTSIL